MAPRLAENLLLYRLNIHITHVTFTRVTDTNMELIDFVIKEK